MLCAHLRLPIRCYSRWHFRASLLARGYDELQSDRPNKLLLSGIKRDELAKAQFKGAGDVKHVERAAANAWRVLSAQVPRPFERCSPQKICIDEAALREIIV